MLKQLFSRNLTSFRQRFQKSLGHLTVLGTFLGTCLGIFAISTVLYADETEKDVLFQIGFPDGKCAEFGRHIKWDDFFGKDAPITHYVVGKNRPRDWYRSHNSTRDWHNAGHSFYSLIEFDAEKDYDVPLYFVVATCYGHPTEPSQVELTVNGTTLEPKRVIPGPPKFPKFNSAFDYGWPEHMTITVPANLIKAGKNTIKMRLFDGSWAFWDYLALREKNEALPEKRTENLLQQFREPGGPMEEVKEILFAVRQPSFDGHWYANFGYYACDTNTFPFPLGGGGALRIMNLDTGETRTLFEDPHGNIRDPQVHYDAKKCIFSYLKAGTKHYHLYEINLDGTGLRQLTDGNWDDIEPTYLPNGDIIFPSSRAKRWVQCWLTGVATLHRCGPNGENVRPISFNPEQENTPWVLPNGQIIYMRWEYIDRSQVHYHHLWTTNPDGTKHQIYYGNQAPGICMLGAKPIHYRKDVPPEERRYSVCATFSPGHGMREHYGTVTLVDPKNGPDDPDSVRRISVSNVHADPWAFSEECFLCVSHDTVRVMDGEGRENVIYRLPQEEVDQKFWVADVQPIIVREREEVIADVTDPSAKTGFLAMANLYTGRQMKDLPPGTVKELLVLEATPIPVHFNGGMMSISSGGTFALTRLLGRIPVNEDGSAYMELPANRAFFFVAMDKDGKPVKRMHSFTQLMPGETNICIGCHEERTMTPTTDDRLKLIKAMSVPPSKPEKIEGLPEVFDYFRDIVPILDKHCLECHNEKSGNVNLNSDLRPAGFVDSYIVLSHGAGGMLGDNRNRPMSNFKPYEIGSCASKFVQILENGHPDKDGNRRVNVSAEELRIVKYWLDCGANYAGTYAADACGLIGWHYSPYNQERKEEGRLVREDEHWTERQEMIQMFERRCISCHKWDDTQRARALPGYMSSGSKKYGANWAYNLSYPEKSNLLRSPLAKEHGGRDVCKRQDENGNWVRETIFKDTNDPDYQILLKFIKRGQDFITRERTHFSKKPFYPNPWYAREMVRYGVLPPDYTPDQPIDPYETDRLYWDRGNLPNPE
ncbi:MAG: polysaccharide lyase family protein [Planctomycetia bacterium]|nr:polysaccharide lyase family protein [Planctomycetia bacterium]